MRTEQELQRLILDMKLFFAMLGLLVISSNTFLTVLGSEKPGPEISIDYPRPTDVFGVGTKIKVKATVRAGVGDAPIAEVRFYANNNLIGVATNAPYNMIWNLEHRADDQSARTWLLKAEAINEFGVAEQSSPVLFNYTVGEPPGTFVEITSPASESIFAEPGSFDFRAEVLASLGDSGPVEFFVGTNLVGILSQPNGLQATNPPLSVTVSNLAAGQYPLTVRYRGANGDSCRCRLLTNWIEVAKLGINDPGIRSDNRIQFGVVTSFPGHETFIEAADDLQNWTRIGTNVPQSNSFTFTDSSPLSTRRWYRVVVPSR